jgi:bifunctional ADP-heptose synthase (sugar kinase/adenylyltransferase)
VVSEAERSELLSALECVDHVVIFDDFTPERLLGLLKPDIHCKGADYAPPSGKLIPERALVEAYGGKVIFLPVIEGLSTSILLNRITGA